MNSTPTESPSVIKPTPSSFSAASLISLLVGILGFATAVITNSTQLQNLVEALNYTDTSGISGEWTGVFREFRVESGRDEIAGERVILQAKQGILTGTITTSEGRQRDWAVNGRFLQAIHPSTHKEGKFINLTYTSTRPNRNQSIGSLGIVAK
jgi:hypothetical protein